MELGIYQLYLNEVMKWTDLEKHTDMTTDNCGFTNQLAGLWKFRAHPHSSDDPDTKSLDRVPLDRPNKLNSIFNKNNGENILGNLFMY